MSFEIEKGKLIGLLGPSGSGKTTILRMRTNGLKPLGNWHSHPSSPSRPSEEYYY